MLKQPDNQKLAKDVQGTGALVVGVAVVAILLIAFPPYRLSFLISIGIAW